MQSPNRTKNPAASSGICFSREDKAVTWLGPAAYWKYVRSPRQDTNAVWPPENKFRSGYWADILSTTDYYPFGMGMVERGDDGKYRYGFNGQERDDEVAGAGNSYTAEFWQYDSRLGRRWKLDKFSTSYPWLSAYSAMENSPIWKIDTKGDSTTYYWRGKIVWISHDGLPNAIVSLNLNEAQMNVFTNQLELHRNAGTADTDAANRLARKFGTVMPVRMLEDFANGNFGGRTLVGEKRDFRFQEVGAYTFVENNVLLIGDQYNYGLDHTWEPEIPEINSKGAWTYRRIHTHPIGNSEYAQKFISFFDANNERQYPSIYPNIIIDRDYLFFHNPDDPSMPSRGKGRVRPTAIAFSRNHIFDKRILENGLGSELWGNLSQQRNPGVKEKSPSENLGLSE